MSNFMGAALTVDDIYPVGSIYMSVNATDPARIFGGTWERIKERFLLGAGDTHPAGSTGGSSTHTHGISGNAAISVIQNTTAYDSSGAKLSDEFPTNLYAYTHEYDSVFDRNNDLYSYASCVKVKGSADEQSNTPPIWQCIFGVASRKIGESGAAV